MKIKFIENIFKQCLVLLSTCICFVAIADTQVFVNVNVIPLDSERVLQNQTVIVEDGTITAIGHSKTLNIPEDAIMIDGKDRYLMPGLSDMHAHVAAYSEDSAPDNNADMLLYLLNGVTTIRNTAGFPGHLEQSKMLEDGEMLGPRMLTTSPLIEGENAVWSWAAKALTPEEGRALVNKYAKEGYKEIKIYHTLDAPTYFAILEEGEKQGIDVIGHVPFSVGINSVLEGSQKSIEHFRGYDIDGLSMNALKKDGGRSAERFASWQYISNERMDDLVARTVFAQTWNVPTLVVGDYLIRAKELSQMRVHPDAKYLPKFILDRYEGSGLLGLFSEESIAKLAEVKPIMQQFLLRLHEHDAKLLIGSDTFPSTVPGFTIIDEMKNYQQAGLSIFEILQIAAVNPSIYLGRENELGSIAVGKQSDMILLNANPLESLDSFWQIEGLLINGTWVTKASLLETLESL